MTFYCMPIKIVLRYYVRWLQHYSMSKYGLEGSVVGCTESCGNQAPIFFVYLSPYSLRSCTKPSPLNGSQTPFRKHSCDGMATVISLNYFSKSENEPLLSFISRNLPADLGWITGSTTLKAL